MKNKIVTILLIALFSKNLNAQNWQLVNSNTTDSIVDLYFKDSVLGFFITNNGKIFTSSDSGNNWNFLYQDSDFSTIDYLAYPERNINIIATNDSLICYHNFIQLGEYKSLRLKIPLSSVSITKDIINQFMTFPTFWNNEIWTSKKVDLMIGGTASVNVVNTLDVSSNYIWTTDATKIYYSNDMGINWQHIVYTPPTLSSGPYQSFYNGSLNMIAVTQYPTVIYKTNNGTNWTASISPIDALYFHFLTSNHFLAYKFLGMGSNEIFRTDDAGNTFYTELLSDTINGIYSKDHNINNIFVFGNNGMLYKSHNGGGLLSTNNIPQKNNLIKIYPNPASTTIYIDKPINIDFQEIKIIDMNGRAIETIKNNFNEININSLNKGIYILQLILNNNQTEYFRFMK